MADKKETPKVAERVAQGKEAAKKAVNTVRSEVSEHLTAENIKNSAPVTKEMITSPLGLTLGVVLIAAILAYPVIAPLGIAVFMTSVYLKSKMSK